MAALTLVQIGLYHAVNFVGEASGVAALFVAVFGLTAFAVVAAISIARPFTTRAQRLQYGMLIATVAWVMQLPVLGAVVWIAEGPPVIANGSLWEIAAFGWFLTAGFCIPLIGFLIPLAGRILDKRKTVNAGRGAATN